MLDRGHNFILLFLTAKTAGGLAAMKARDRRVQFVLVTSSKAEKDVVTSYDLQANSYVTKPVDLESFRKIVQGINELWFSVVRYAPE